MRQNGTPSKTTLPTPDLNTKNYLLGVNREFQNEWAKLVVHFKNMGEPLYGCSTQDLWEDRQQFVDGQISVKPMHIPVMECLWVYITAVFRTIPHMPIELGIIIGSWLYAYHERVNGIVRPAFTKPVLLLGDDAPLLARQIYWMMRTSGVPARNNPDVIQEWPGHQQFFKDWDHRLCVYDFSKVFMDDIDVERFTKKVDAPALSTRIKQAIRGESGNWFTKRGGVIFVGGAHQETLTPATKHIGMVEFRVGGGFDA